MPAQDKATPWLGNRAEGSEESQKTTPVAKTPDVNAEAATQSPALDVSWLLDYLVLKDFATCLVPVGTLVKSPKEINQEISALDPSGQVFRFC